MFTASNYTEGTVRWVLAGTATPARHLGKIYTREWLSVMKCQHSASCVTFNKVLMNLFPISDSGIHLEEC